MRWTRRGRSENLEDRRAESGGRGRFPFPMGFPRGGGGARATGRPRFSLGTLLLLAVLFFVFKGNFLGGGSGGGGIQLPELPSPQGGSGINVPFPQSPPGEVGAGVPGRAGEEEMVDFISFVLDDLQETWHKQLPEYRDAKLVLFRDGVRSGCGFGQSAMGPFYCPADEKVYVDLSFYEDLRRRFGAPGDFAQAYVLAHEIGHHVQKVTGIEPQVRRAQKQNPRGANQLSVRMELQADCLAGVWGHSAGQRGILEAGDIQEGLGAAAAIGDDNIQKMTRGRVQPEGFTHGSSEQRVEWLRRGLESGSAENCDTF